MIPEIASGDGLPSAAARRRSNEIRRDPCRRTGRDERPRDRGRVAHDFLFDLLS
jgi:hypothetical protein